MPFDLRQDLLSNLLFPCIKHTRNWAVLQVWYDYSMYECDHELKPIVYGYMYGDMISQINNYDVMYGGMRKASDSPEWFCIRCLEDIYL